MTKDPKKGTGCEIPTPATTFYSDDERVYCWFYWDYAYEKDELECNWYDPDGELYELDSSEATYTKGCWYPSIYISEYYPASAPGQWRVDVYMKGIKRFTEYFTIVSENTTTTTVSTSSTTTTISPTTTTIKPTTTTVKSTTTTTTPCSLNFIYGKDSQETELLRYLRDEVLSQTPVGQEIIKLYYQWSPAIVNAMEENEKLKKEVKEMIDGVLPLIEGSIE